VIAEPSVMDTAFAVLLSLNVLPYAAGVLPLLPLFLFVGI
jgi:hypothetical protein